MIAWNRVGAIIQRHLLIQIRDIYRLSSLLFWPTLDLMLFGFTAMWIQKEYVVTGQLITVLMGIVLWEVIQMASLDLAVNTFQEIYDRNLLNLFSSPLTLVEYLLALMLLSLGRIVVVVVVCLVAIILLYSVNLFPTILALLPHVMLLIVSGWSLGFFVCSLLVYSGKKVEHVIFPLIFSFLPISGALYPLEILPRWIQFIGKALPMSYVFESMRSSILSAHLLPANLMISLGLNILYIVLSLCLFAMMFRKSKQYGLARLE